VAKIRVRTPVLLLSGFSEGVAKIRVRTPVLLLSGFPEGVAKNTHLRALARISFGPTFFQKVVG
jgi:hypothetical protein